MKSGQKPELKFFGVSLRSESIAEFRQIAREEGTLQSRLFADMIKAYKQVMGHNESRDPLSTPSQTAPIAPRQATKRPARVREGGAK